jgi:hypothetical protein
MTVAYDINREDGLVTITGTEAVEIEQACELGRRMLRDAHFDPKLPHLVDLRGLVVDRDASQSRAFKAFVLDEYAPKINASVAVVISETLDDQSCAALYHLTCSMDRTELFDHYDQALKWLMRREFVTP